MSSKYLPKLGMPYMGNKRSLARPLINFMKKDHIKRYSKEPKYFYDVFGGGGSMSFEALQHHEFKEVHYNEFNPAIVALLTDIKENGISNKYYEWVSREEFIKHKDGVDLKAGICQTVWSFGNNQKDYLYSKEIEEHKRLISEFVVNNCEDSLKKFNEIFNINIPYLNSASLFNDETMTQRRLRVSKYIKSTDAERFDLQNCERVVNIERLQQLQQLQQLRITNLSYEKLKIDTPIDETIVYFDPPYQGAKKYKHDIDHDNLFEHMKESPCVIYVSSYDMPLECIFELKHRSSLSATNNAKEVVEKLFINRV